MKSIVLKVRRQFEKRQINLQLLQKLYHKYNPEIEDLQLFVERAQHLFPRLNCGLTSVYLKEMINFGTIIQGKYGDQCHTFLLITDSNNIKTVIDITADQYGGPSVYVGPFVPPYTQET